jgi:hypothetical protein
MERHAGGKAAPHWRTAQALIQPVKAAMARKAGSNSASTLIFFAS